MKTGNNKRTVLIVAALSTFLVTFMGSSVTVALPTISSEMAIDAVVVSWIPTAYLLATASTLLPFGRLADIKGRKWILSRGIIVFTIAAILILFVKSADVFIGLRVAQGISSAMMAASSVAIITSAFPAGERGRALGISVATTYLGLSLGPVLGGILTQNFGWRSIFFTAIPMSAVVIPFVWLKLKGEWAEARGEPFDRIGATIYALSLVGIIYGFSSLPGTLGIALICAGAGGMIGFVRHERRTKSPLLDVATLSRNKGFVLSNITHFLSYLATFPIAFLISLYLQYIKGLDPQGAGLVLLAMVGVQSGFSMAAGRLSDRIAPQTLVSIGLGLAAVGLARFSFLNPSTPTVEIIVNLVLIGFGRALIVSPNTNAIMASVKPNLYGVASATLATMRQLGMTFGLGIIMILFALYIGRVEITPSQYPMFLFSTRVAFIVFAAICGAAIATSAVRRARRVEQ